MGPRQTLRRFLWGICLAVVLCGARSARASAPMCDETASSRIAPPPILPIRDVKFEAAFPCDDAPISAAPVAVVPEGPEGPASPPVPTDATATESWVRATAVRVVAPAAGRSSISSDAAVPVKPGFSPSVFRPPRG